MRNPVRSNLLFLAFNGLSSHQPKTAFEKARSRSRQWLSDSERFNAARALCEFRHLMSHSIFPDPIRQRHEQPSAAMPLKLGQISNDERNARVSRLYDRNAIPNVPASNTIDNHDANTTARGSSKGGRRFQ